MMRTWGEKVKYKYGVRRPGGDNFEIVVAGVLDEKLNGVEYGFHTIPLLLPSPSPQPPMPVPDSCW